MDQVAEIPVEDLPYWMRRARRGWDWGLVLAAALGILAAWPFVIHPGLPRTNASENYVFLAADYADTLREGRLYPRWSPHVLNGYGAPIPHYFPPGAPYTTALIKTLFTNDAVRAVRMAFIGAFVIAAAAVYSFVKRRASAASGLLATVLFLHNPYIGYTAPYTRGDLAEFMALALMPLLLWTMDRLTADNRPADLLFAGLAAAALLLTHPPLAAVAFALAAALSLFAPIDSRPTHWPLVLAALAFGVGLSAFFWIPAWFERDLVQWIERPTALHITLAELFRPLRPVDLSELFPGVQLTLGTTALLVSVLAFVSTLWARQQRIFHTLFLIIAILLILLALVALPRSVWLLGAVGLCLAIAGAGVVSLRARLSPRWRRVYLAGVLTALLALALPVLQVPRWPSSFGSLQPIDYILYEQRGAGVAVLPPGFPLPITLPAMPPPNHFLLSGYEAGSVSKIALTQITNRTQINLISHASHQERYQVTSDSSTPVNLLTAYFAGWQAFAAGRPVPVYPDPQTGLIGFDIPPMNGELVVSLGPTSVRQLGWGVSIVALGMLLILTWRRFRNLHVYPSETDLLTTAEARLLSFVTAAFAVIVLFFNSPSSPVNLYEQPGHGLRDAISVRYSTNAGLEMLGHAVADTELTPGETLRLTLYWQALRALPASYQVRVTLRHQESEQAVYRTDLRSPGHYPTSRWRTYLYVSDRYEIQLPPDIPEGTYEVQVDIFDCSPECTGRLTFFNVNAQNIGQTLILPTPIKLVGR
jgi:hypothetical protein